MKFYYIDDSFFKDSTFSLLMRERMLTLCELQDVSIIFISGTAVDFAQIEEFVDECSTKNIQLICSPAEFDIEGVRGVLTTTFLSIDNFTQMTTYSGSVVSYDSQTMICERLYLELFPKYTKDEVSDDVTHEIEEILSDIITKQKKHRTYN